MQSFKIVVGYFPAVDRLPSVAEKHGLCHPLAFVIESYDPKRPDAFFDSELYVGLVGTVCSVLEADHIRTMPRETLCRGVTSPDSFRFPDTNAMKKYFEDIPEVEQEPFDYLFFCNGSTTLGIMVSEPWAHVGGPDLYHDSYTQALFTAEDLSERIIGETERYS